MHLDDIERESVPRVEQYLSKIKVIRRIASKIIEFLAQLEDFQKKLWLKKKFVVETNYCIALSIIPESFYTEIAGNHGQREEWVHLHSIDEIKRNGEIPGYSNPLKPEFLKTQPTLMIDTQHFNSEFTVRLLDVLDAIDSQTDCILINSENFQAISLLQSRYRHSIDCLYIDPPYNARSSEIAYKNAYKHSSWLSLLEGRIALSQHLLSDAFVHIVAIDENEQERLGLLLQEMFAGSYHLLVTVIHNHKGIQSQNFSNISEFCYFTFPSNSRKSIAKKKRAEYSLANLNLRDKGNESLRTDAKTCFYPFIVRDGVIQGTGEIPPEDFHPAAQTVKTGPSSFEVWPIDVNGVERKWRYAKDSIPAVLSILKAEPGRNGLEINIYKEEENYKTVWSDSEFNAGLHGTRILNSMIPNAPFSFPKSLPLVVESCRAGLNDNRGGMVLDYFAGSGTTGHAIIQLNREDGGKRKGILVEMGQYFDSVLVPRLKKVAFTPVWSEGKPGRSATEDEAKNSPRIIKYIRLESYEDTLNNLQLRRSRAQQLQFDAAECKKGSRLKEQYILGYMLNVETQGSQSLLNVQGFTDPMAYTLKVKLAGSDEGRETNVDLLETFNWLIGLTVQHIAAPQCFTATFERDSENRLKLKGRLKQVDSSDYWFRTVTGTTPDGRKTLVIWRKRPGGETPEGVEQDNLVLDEWFTRRGYSSKDSEFDLIYVNGTNNLENLRAPDDTWKVRLIEDDFHRLMFASEGI
jgi:adenine-specific DNA-methyltransferase